MRIDRGARDDARQRRALQRIGHDPLDALGLSGVVVVTTGSYADPTWITSLDWSKIINTPTTLAGYGIVDEVVTRDGVDQVITGSIRFPFHSISLQSSQPGPAVFAQASLLFDGVSNQTFTFPDASGTISLEGHTHDWSDITGTPTTIAGYGITDAYTKIESDARFAPIAGPFPWADVTGTPTTLSGYGITDAVPDTRNVNTSAPLAGGGDLSGDLTLTTSMATNKLIGRGTAGTGVMEEIDLGTGLSLSGTTLNGQDGTVTTVSVVTANGVSGTVANATTTPAITLILGAITPTTVNGLVITPTIAGTLTVQSAKTFTAKASITVAGTDGKILTLNNNLTFSGTDGASVAFGSGGTVVYQTRAINTTSPLSGGGNLSADRTLTTSMATNRLIGRTTAGTGVMEEIAVGSGLSLSAGTLSSTSTSTSGTYTPTASAVANVTSGGTGDFSMYIQTGSLVFVFGRLTSLVQTTVGNQTDIDITLPVATANFTNGNQASGTTGSFVDEGGRVAANVGAQTARLTFICSSVVSHAVTFAFAYQIQ